jgi:hypothetical protein
MLLLSRITPETSYLTHAALSMRFALRASLVH